ncbi:serine hydrolase [Novosphingobium sp. Gsoil 351]|uniref:serine hydrolase domain-containing protein n=1 Tax=Novosphingobium sp. Gsoil 351 TaxID=2675225 RepID=UPI0012B47340|nr:serine hydrolase domain-containing protein [Novosphingobium sp. Gsoil 351]QGN54368.1 serine hydrolase [Novosphingobium sp. Gsoil 351]
MPFDQLTLSRRAVFGNAALLGLGTAFAPHAALAKPAAAAASSAAFPSVTAFVDGYVAKRKVPGMLAMMGFGQRPATVIARGTEGFNDPDPETINTLYRVYSMTKPVTGMAAMMLIDAGKMSLDQPLSDILPKFAKMQVQVTPDGSITDLRPAKTPITIRHLLTHSAGLGYSIIQKGPIKAAYEAAGVIPGQVSKVAIPGLDRGKPVGSLALFADRLAELPLVYEPGTQWSYSVALDLMGRVIEVVSGKPFDVFLQERLFGPLGMSSTGFRVAPKDIHRLSTNYAVLAGTPIPIDPGEASIFADKPPFPMGGAGLVTSPHDYDRFLRMIANYGAIDGKRVMTERAIRTGTSNLLPPGASTKGTFANGAGFGAGGRVGLGDAAGTYGWGGAAGTVALVHLKYGLRGGLYTQYMPSEAYPVHADFPVAVMADLAAMAPARRKAA